MGIPGLPASVGVRVSPPPRDDHGYALNQVLSEVIDAILDVRQADRRVPETQALRHENLRRREQSRFRVRPAFF